MCGLNDGSGAKLYTQSSYTHPSSIQCNAATEINNLKTSVSNGKSAIASAITGKGVSTASDATFQTMANNISNIVSASSEAKVFGIYYSFSHSSGLNAYDKFLEQATPQGIELELSSDNGTLNVIYPIEYNDVLLSCRHEFSVAKNESGRERRSGVDVYIEIRDDRYWPSDKLVGNAVYSGYTLGYINDESGDGGIRLITSDQPYKLKQHSSGKAMIEIGALSSWMNTGTSYYQDCLMHFAHYFVTSV